MNYGFKSIVIEPFNGYLDFQGPLNPENASGSITLKGDIHLHLTKSVKVKSATIKFKGYSRVCHQNTINSVDISTPILPKLKTQIFSSTTTLGPGQVTLPWEMEILNVYPASVMIKRASINYKIELSISLGLKRVVTSTYPIVIRRHLLPCKEVATRIPAKMYSKTISTKFHYEITAPRIICIAQTFIPFHVKLLSIGSQKRVLSIRTQILQIELYRCNALPKSEANMTRFKTQLMKPKRPLPSGKKELNKYAKYTKRTIPAIIHTLDETEPMSSNQPILLRHPLDEYLSLGLESPLASIYHQLEITFQFGAKFEDIRAKIPILISSTNNNDTQANNNNQPPPMPSYPFERLNLPEPLYVMDETRLEQNGNAPTIKALAPSGKGSMDNSAGSSPTTTTADKNDIDNASIELNHSSDDSNGSSRLHKNQSKVNIDSALCMNNNSSSSSNTTSPTAVNTTTRSTANLCISLGSHDVDDDDKENKYNTMDSGSLKTHHKYNSMTTNTFTDNKYSNSSNDNTLVNNSLPIPPVKHRRPSNTSILSSNDTTGKSSSSPTLQHQQPQRYLSTDNIESSNGMWPRPPDSSVPSQWRRRSASQSHINDNNQITQKQKLLNNTRIQTKSQSNLFSAANNPNYNPNVNNNKLITQNVRLHPSSSPTPTPPIMPKNKHRLQYQQSLQLQIQQQQQQQHVSDCSSSVYESTNCDDDDDDDDEYDDESYTDGSDKSSYRAPSLVSGESHTESSSYDLQSRPTSPIYPNASGLPPYINLRPQDANPVALLEESFVPPSPGSLASTPVVSSHNLASTSRNYNNRRWYDSTTFGSQSMDMMSVISNAQSSVLDTDADMLRLIQQMAVERQQEITQERSLEQHYTNAELPPIPRRSSNDNNNNQSSTNNNSKNNNNRPTTIYYVDDSDGEEIDNAGMYDSDDQSLANLSFHEKINHQMNDDDDQVPRDLYIPPIAGSPLPPLPHEITPPKEESVCICPRHGVTVHK
ncbi:unnamed protein product [Cunninghamella blakesleeana]